LLTSLDVRAAPFALLKNWRKAERGTKQFPACVLRPPPLPKLPVYFNERSH